MVEDGGGGSGVREGVAEVEGFRVGEEDYVEVGCGGGFTPEASVM